MAEGERELSGVSFIRVLIPFMRTPSSQPHHLPKVPPPDTIAVGVRISIYELGWGENINIQSIIPMHAKIPF